MYIYAESIRTGPPFRGSAIPGVRVRVRVRVRVNPSGPPEWRTRIESIYQRVLRMDLADVHLCIADMSGIILGIHSRYHSGIMLFTPARCIADCVGCECK